MEIVEQNVRTFTFPTSPKIVVVHDDIFNRRTQQADVTIIGDNEQYRLGNKNRSTINIIGAVSFHDKSKSLKRKKNAFAQHFDSEYGFRDQLAAIMINNTQFIINNFYEHVEDVIMKNEIVLIPEPEVVMVQSKKGQSWEQVYYRSQLLDDQKHMGFKAFKGKDAIAEALEDLEKCYQISLFVCHDDRKMFDASTKRVAFAPLSLGIPAHNAAFAAISAVIKCINNDLYKNHYDLIEFVVPRLEDFNMYKEILSDYKIDSMGKAYY